MSKSKSAEFPISDLPRERRDGKEILDWIHSYRGAKHVLSQFLIEKGWKGDRSKGMRSFVFKEDIFGDFFKFSLQQIAETLHNYYIRERLEYV